MRQVSRIFRYAAMIIVLAGQPLAATDTVAELKARADAAQGGEKVKLCLEYAHVQLAAADNLFNQGDVEKGQATIREVVDYAHKAATSASASGKHLKETEIDLRKLGKRMHDVGESLAFEDRDPVRKAVDEIEQIRSDLLIRMWGPQAEPKGKS
jgi:endonuclease IV